MLYYSYIIVQHNYLQVGIAFLMGIFFWTFFEYLLHRFVFHFVAEREKVMRIVYLIHGNHHEYPRDKERLFMPPVPSLIISSLIFTSMFLFAQWTGVPKYVFAFFAGFMFGYLLYGTMHYAIHAWNPPFKWMKSLWRNHHLHHYKNEQCGFGVSTTLWDRLFGTMFYSDKKVNET